MYEKSLKNPINKKKSIASPFKYKSETKNVLTPTTTTNSKNKDSVLSKNFFSTNSLNSKRVEQKPVSKVLISKRLDSHSPSKKSTAPQPMTGSGHHQKNKSFAHSPQQATGYLSLQRRSSQPEQSRNYEEERSCLNVLKLEPLINDNWQQPENDKIENYASVNKNLSEVSFEVKSSHETSRRSPRFREVEESNRTLNSQSHYMTWSNTNNRATGEGDTLHNPDPQLRSTTLPENYENTFRFSVQSLTGNDSDFVCSSEIEEFKRMQEQLNKAANENTESYTKPKVLTYKERLEAFYKTRNSLAQQPKVYYTEIEENNNTSFFHQFAESHLNPVPKLSREESEEFLNTYSNIAKNYKANKKAANSRDESLGKDNKPKIISAQSYIDIRSIHSKSPNSLSSANQPNQNKKPETLNSNQKFKITPVKKSQSRDLSPQFTKGLDCKKELDRKSNDAVIRRKSLTYDETPEKRSLSKNKQIDRQVDYKLMSSSDILKHCQAILKKAKSIPLKTQSKGLNK